MNNIYIELIMKNLTIARTNKTPLISFDGNTNHLEITGRSTPENPREFYKRLFDLIENYTNLDKLTLDIDLDYFNSTSNKCIYSLILLIDKKFNTVNINWYHDSDDVDMIDYASEISSISKVKINLVSKENAD